MGALLSSFSSEVAHPSPGQHRPIFIYSIVMRRPKNSTHLRLASPINYMKTGVVISNKDRMSYSRVVCCGRSYIIMGAVPA